MVHVLQRPLDADLLQYATFDVVFLRLLSATIQVGRLNYVVMAFFSPFLVMLPKILYFFCNLYTQLYAHCKFFALQIMFVIDCVLVFLLSCYLFIYCSND